MIEAVHNDPAPRDRLYASLRRASVVELLRQQEASDALVTVGGTIPAPDIPELKKLGVAAVVTPGASASDIVEFIRTATKP